MTPFEIQTISQGRLASWTQRLVEDHATPLVLVGIGHDHVSGRVVLCTVDEDEMTPAVLAAFLRKAAMLLDPKQKGAIPL